MKLKNKKITEEIFDFTKKPIKTKKKLSFINLIIPILLFDMMGTVWTLSEQARNLELNQKQDFLHYQSLLNMRLPNEENKIQVNIEKLKIAFNNFKPQTNMGQILLLNEMTYYKNEYFSLNQNNEITSKQGAEISQHIDKTIKKEYFEKNNYTMQCNYQITCNILKYSVNDKIQSYNDQTEMNKRKKFYELTHKKEMQDFYNLPYEVRNRMLQEKQDPISKNFW